MRSEFQEFAGSGGENLGAAGGDQNIVLDADAADAFHVNPRFYGHDVTCLQKLFLVPRDSGILVDFQADSVARAVNEIAG